jgi:glycosyltransferase involved in cell wall biosynthesis
MPSVSIILPTFNRVQFLAAAVESVLAQTHTDWEMIIADDGSGEETRAYLRQISDPRVRILWLTHCGNPARVRNAAIEAAGGDHLAFLDSDDLWAPTKLQRQCAAMRARPGIRWSYCACRRIDAQGRPLSDEPMRARPPVDGWIFEPLLKLETAVAMPTVIADRELVRAIGGFDEQQLFGEFHDLCLRLALQSEVVALGEPLCAVRSHAEHYSGDRIAALESWMRLYEKMARLTSPGLTSPGLTSPGLTSNGALQAYCTRMRSETSLQLARVRGDREGYLAICSTLRGALAFSWRYPQWWLGALKRLVRPAVPAVLAAALLRLRG